MASVEPDTLASISSIVAGFGTTVFLFRLQREIQMAEQGKKVWIPWSDWLLITTIIISLLCVLLPIVIVDVLPIDIRIPAAFCSLSLILMIGYPFSILAHYNLLFSEKQNKSKQSGVPTEKIEKLPSDTETQEHESEKSNSVVRGLASSAGSTKEKIIVISTAVIGVTFLIITLIRYAS